MAEAIRYCSMCGESLCKGDEVKVDVEEDLYFCDLQHAMEFYGLNPELTFDAQGRKYDPAAFLNTRILA